MSRRSLVATAIGAICVLTFSGCAPGGTERSLGIDVDEVSSVEYFEYPWSEVSDTLEQLTIDDPEVLSEWVRAYTDMPVSDVPRADEDELVGKQTQSSRFILKDGRTIEISAIWVGPKDVIVVWPDETVLRTTWGSPDLFDAYEETGVVQGVSARERPAVALRG